MFHQLNIITSIFALNLHCILTKFPINASKSTLRPYGTTVLIKVSKKFRTTRVTSIFIQVSYGKRSNAFIVGGSIYYSEKKKHVPFLEGWRCSRAGNETLGRFKHVICCPKDLHIVLLWDWERKYPVHVGIFAPIRGVQLYLVCDYNFLPLESNSTLRLWLPIFLQSVTLFILREKYSWEIW